MHQNGGRSSQKFQHFKDDSEGDLTSEFCSENGDFTETVPSDEVCKKLAWKKVAAKFDVGV